MHGSTSVHRMSGRQFKPVHFSGLNHEPLDCVQKHSQLCILSPLIIRKAASETGLNFIRSQGYVPRSMDGLNEFALLTKLARDELIRVLESIPGTKELVVDANLMRPLDKLASMSLLQRHGCMRVQQLHMEKAVVWDESLEYSLFLVRPTVGVARRLCELISANPTRHYTVVVVDRRQNFFEVELERYGLYGQVNFHEFNLLLVPLESDLFSLEIPPSTSRVCRYEERSMARVLWQLQSIYGLIPTRFGFGDASRRVEAMLHGLFTDEGEPAASADQPISHMFLFDRQLDMVSTLMTCLTYESMLNDTFHYSCGKVNFGERVEAKLAKTNKNGQCGGKRARAFALDNSDVIFSAVRNEHMTSVFPFLSAKAKSLQVSVTKASSLDTVEDMRAFVSNELKSLKEQQSRLEVHISACEAVMEATREWGEQHFSLEQSIVRGEVDDAEVMGYLESSMYKQSNPWRILQLACLWSIRENGLSTRNYDAFRQNFLQAYGFEHATTLYALSGKGLLQKCGRSTSPVTAAIASSISNVVGTSTIAHHLTSPTSKQPRVPVGHSTEVGAKYKNKGGHLPSFPSLASSLGLCPQVKQQQSAEPTIPGYKGDSASSKRTSYMFSDAYTPLMAKLVENVIEDGWNEARLKKVLGEHQVFSSKDATLKPDNRLREALLMCFVGGITYAEVAALRCIAHNHNFRIIILTTSVLHREVFFRGLAEF